MSTEKSIIAICGAAGAGKSTLADLLIEHGSYVRLSFAAPLKAMLKTLLRMQGAEDRLINRMLFGDLKEAPSEFLSGRSPRHCMQTLGTEWRNTIDLNLWTNIWKRSTEFVKKIVVDDLRFLHEEAAVRSLGGRIVLVTRPGFGASQSHVSETQFVDIKPDLILPNINEPLDMLNSLKSWMFP